MSMSEQQKTQIIEYAIEWLGAEYHAGECQRRVRDAETEAERARAAQTEIAGRLIVAVKQAGQLGRALIVDGKVIIAKDNYVTFEEPAIIA
jgi:predicted adenine nucleotide alpha hydrolase (AANH) superfamily ATPase